MLLDFTVTGHYEGGGYSKITIPTEFITDTSRTKLYVDDAETSFEISRASDSWLIAFNYPDGIHKVDLKLDMMVVPEFYDFMISPTLMLLSILILLIVKKSRPQPISHFATRETT